MYPAYPLISLNAGLSFHIILQVIGHFSNLRFIPKISPVLKLGAITTFILAAIGFSFLRTASLTTGYTAPLRIYSPLVDIAKPGDTVCLGKEWYRFPSSYFLPDGVRAKFIKSAFTGLLPGEYSEAKNGFGLFPGTWLIPPGMNDQNREDPGKYVSDEMALMIQDFGN
jgi:alpha-1,2-mannosyltransferase